MPTTMPARAEAPRPIYVVDDDDAVRAGVRRLLGVTGRPSRGYDRLAACLEAVREERPACLLLDEHLPDGSGLALQRTLAAEAPGLPVVFMSGAADAEVAIRAFRGGAVDFLLKPLDGEALLRAADRAVALDGQRRAAQAAQARVAERLARLTAREREVLALVVEGRLNKQAAARLGVSERTVKTHRGRVMRKMGAGSLAELVRMCEPLGLAVGRPAGG